MPTDLDAWRSSFVERLQPRLAAALRTLASAFPTAEVVGLGAYSDSDAGSVIPALNTRTNRDALVASDPEFAEDYTWSIGEWDRTPFDHPDASQLDDLPQELDRVRREAQEALGADGLLAFRQAAWSAVAEAMANLFDEGFFDRWPDAVQVWIPSDGVVRQSVLADWNARCNSAADAERFRAFITVE